MSAWLFDLGNSRLKCAPLHDDGRIGDSLAVDHDGQALPAGWMDALPPRIDAAYVASVAPVALRVQLLDALTRRCRRIVQARSVPAMAGVRIAYAQPDQLGVDRFLALLGGRARGAGPWLVVGVGTALTIDLLDADGRHRGGRIAPSPTLMRTALQRRMAQLPGSGGDYVEFAEQTQAALASGCLGAALGLIERSVRTGEGLLAAAPRLLLHGGGAAALLPLLAGAGSAPALVLEGLARWAAVAAVEDR